MARRQSSSVVIKVSMAIAVASFFLPWIRLFPPASKKTRLGNVSISVAKNLQLSGFAIPQAANSEAAKTAVQLAELFQKKSDIRAQLRQAGPKAYAVYLLPLAHILIGFLLLRYYGVHWFVGVLGFTAFIVPPIGLAKISKALVQSQGLATAQYGLWLSLFAYWGLTYAAAAILRQRRP